MGPGRSGMHPVARMRIVNKRKVSNIVFIFKLSDLGAVSR
jgi:hypothetical protein